MAIKILSLMCYAKLDLHALALKTEQRELQMDVVIMKLEEMLEIKLPLQELAVFKKEFDSFYLVPLRVLESKMLHYLGTTTPLNQVQTPETPHYFEVSLLVLLNRILEEWERFQAHLRKRLLKKFIDFDANGDGVLTLEEFRELMKSLEGAGIANERVIVLFNEALEMSSNDGATKGSGDPDKMSPACFVEAVIRNRIGGYGSEFLDFEFAAGNQ